MKFWKSDAFFLAVICLGISLPALLSTLYLAQKSWLVPGFCLCIIALIGLHAFWDFLRRKDAGMGITVREALGAGIYACYVLAIPLAGFYAASVLFIAAMFYYTTDDKKHARLPTAALCIGVLVAIHFIFEGWLGMVLPESVFS